MGKAAGLRYRPGEHQYLQSCLGKWSQQRRYENNIKHAREDKGKPYGLGNGR
jgi:hypothetical protein